MLYIASDHAGFELKQKIVELLLEDNINIIDIGPSDYDKNDDYPIYAKAMAKEILQDLKGNIGILLCSSGIGMSIAANRFGNIRAALCHNEKSIRLSREHNDANILVLNSDCSDNNCNGLDELAQKYMEWIELFISTEFSNEPRHIRRIKEIEDLD
jgi:ribose 5-phosphate isomerase B